jgi:hypothetical protein
MADFTQNQSPKRLNQSKNRNNNNTSEEILTNLIGDKIARVEAVGTGLDSRITEVVDTIEQSISVVNQRAIIYALSNRPTMMEFNEAPDDSGTTFSSDIIIGTHIVFLNGLMQFEGRDYEIIQDKPDTFEYTRGITGVTNDLPYTIDEPLSIEFYSAPSNKDILNVYGVSSKSRLPQIDDGGLAYT